MSSSPYSGRNVANLPPVGLEGSIPFSSLEFERVRAHIHQHAGIDLHSGKQSMVYNRLVHRLRACNAATFSQYLLQLDHPASPEWEHFTNALTTNLTSFFREQHHFPVLAEHLRTLEPRQTLNIWCAAASTGEEPYAIAITVLEALGRNAGAVRIIASDIDTGVLRTAEIAEYSEQALSNVPADLARKYFQRSTVARPGFVSPRPEVRKLITFRQINLQAPVWPRMDLLDAIFCRNVMIYFDKATQERVVERFATLMHPGALLFTGHSEHIAPGGRSFVFRGKTVYQRLSRQSDAAPAPISRALASTK